jgi:hypothetical protein
MASNLAALLVGAGPGPAATARHSPAVRPKGPPKSRPEADAECGTSSRCAHLAAGVVQPASVPREVAKAYAGSAQGFARVMAQMAVSPRPARLARALLNRTCMRAPQSTRGDALLFYSLAISSFIESTTPEFVVNLKQIFTDDVRLTDWLEHTWRREEVGHGRLMREQLERLWPEFDLPAAYADFNRRYVPRCEVSLLRPTPALEALARCVTEAQAAAAYRALASYTRDPGLERMLLGMAADEARHYSSFRRAFERHNLREQHGPLKRLQVILARSLLVQGEDLPLAFSSLNGHWKNPQPFPRKDYTGYLQLVAGLMHGHFPLRAATRMLMKPVAQGTWIVGCAFSGAIGVIHFRRPVRSSCSAATQTPGPRNSASTHVKTAFRGKRSDRGEWITKPPPSGSLSERRRRVAQAASATAHAPRHPRPDKPRAEACALLQAHPSRGAPTPSLPLRPRSRQLAHAASSKRPRALERSPVMLAVATLTGRARL